MARRRASALGLVGCLLMAVTIALPVLQGIDVAWPWPVLAALAILLSWGYPRLAWLPASVWVLLLGLVSAAYYAETGTLEPASFFVGLAGGICVLVGSLLARRRARPQTDVSAFD